MRSVVLFGLGLGLAASLLHCAANDPSPGTPDAGGLDAGDTEADGSSDAAEPVDDDASDAGLVGDAGNCSVDNWCRVALPPNVSPSAVWTFAPNDALAVGSGGMIHWDGTSWSVVTDQDDQGAGLDGLSNLWASGPGDVWAVTRWDRRLVHGTRTGLGAAFTWSSSETSSLEAIELVAGRPGELWISGHLADQTPMLERADVTGGGPPSFVQVPLPPVNDLYVRDLWVSPNGEVWFVGGGDDGLSFVAHGQRSGDDVVWTRSLLVGPNTIDLTAIDGIEGATTPAEQNDVWVLGTGKANFHHALLPDGGQLWSPFPNSTNMELTALWMSGKDDAWAAGNIGFIRHWDGTSWKISQLSVGGRPIFEALTSIHGSSPNDIWAVGPNILVHHTGGGK